MMRLAWIDIETTGLRPEIDDILEVAIILTDDKLNRIAELERVFPTSLSHSQFAPDALVMHYKNGLVNDIKNLEPDEHVETVVTDFLRRHNGGYPQSIVLAGSSVHFDRSFLSEHAPLALSEVHHRMLDVSSLKMALELLTGERIDSPKERAHRARRDIVETIDEFRSLWLALDGVDAAAESFKWDAAIEKIMCTMPGGTA